MKKIFLLPFLSVAFLTLTLSCENEFNVSDDWEDVTVVYGLLDPAADTNWVRVERGYLGSGPARESYDSPDSLYYDSLIVYMLVYDENRQKVDSLDLIRDNTSRNRLPGPFTTNGYRIYRTTEKIGADFKYELNVKKIGAKFTDAKATTEIVEPKREGNLNGFTFIQPSSIDGRPRNFAGTIELNRSNRAQIYQVFFTLEYTEFDIPTKTSIIKSINFLYGTFEGQVPENGTIVLSKPKASFYNLLAGKIPVDPNKLRFIRPEAISLTAYAGGEDLVRYMKLNEPSSGINQTKPEFPGIESGTGLFSSRTSTTLDDINLYLGNNKPNFERYYLDAVLCDRNFAVLSGADTVYCAFGPDGKPESVKF